MRKLGNRTMAWLAAGLLWAPGPAAAEPVEPATGQRPAGPGAALVPEPATADPEPADPARPDPEAADPEPADPEPEIGRMGPRLLTDIFVVGGVTASHSLAYGPVRRPLFGEASVGRVLHNLVDPLRRARQGWAEDDDPFSTNFIAHPVSWGAMGLYLKERGYSNGSALLFTQIHSLAWEYVIEGLYQKPSGLDLLTNFASASTAIFVFHAVAERAGEREAKGIHHRALAALNPLRPLRGVLRPGADGGGVRARVGPAAGGVNLTLSLVP